jgi:hypothetical protein
MQEKSPSEQYDHGQSTEIKAITEIDETVLKLKKIKSHRKAFIVVGFVFAALWVIGYTTASNQTSADSTSVALIGPIFSSPLLIFGIVLLIVGVVGNNIAQKQLDDAKRTRDILEKSIQSTK